MKMRGGLREVLTAYKGRDPFENMPQETLERLGLTGSPVLPNGETA